MKTFPNTCNEKLLKKGATLTLIFLLAFLTGCTETINPFGAKPTKGKEEAATKQKRDNPETSAKQEQAPVEENKPATDDATKSDAPLNGQQKLDKALDAYNLALELWEGNDRNGAIAALDKAFDYIFEVDENINPELLQQKDDLRFLLSKRVLEIYSTRDTTVAGNFGAIPLVINKDVEAEIKRFQTMERNFFLEAYKVSGEYRPRIVQKLTEAGLPQELSWLPLIESGYKVHAYSPARALGLWQFIPSTGYKFGLNRDTWVDERMDPWKSTDAAIGYLTELHTLFGDWMTALAAYNCGEGRVLRVISTQKVEYLDNFWDLYYKLPNETARYVPRFLAILAIVKNPKKYGFELPEVNSPIDYETVAVERSVPLRAIALKMGIEEELLVKLNPELRQRATPSTPYELRLPLGHKDTAMAMINDIPIMVLPPQSQASAKTHQVKKGETLGILAKKYRTSVQSLMSANNLRKNQQLFIGQKLKIPGKYRGEDEKPTVSREAKVTPKTIKHEVKQGETLWTLARKYGTTTTAIKRQNNMKDSEVQLGQVLIIPES